MSYAYRLLPLALVVLLGTCVRAQKGNDGSDFYDLGHVVKVELEMHDPHWKKKLNAWKRNGSSDRITATLRVDGVRFDSVGVRLKGNSSYFAPVREDKKKLPFNIKVSYTDDGQRVEGKYRTLKLSNVYRDPSYLREAVSYAIARDYVVAPRCNYAQLTVDGDYFGLYNLSESVDEQFWTTNFGTEDGILFKCDPEDKKDGPATCPPSTGASLKHIGPDSICYESAYELKKSDHGWAELIDLTRAVSDEDSDLGEVLNVDETLWMLAFDNALANLDSYLGAFCHNYYLFKDAEGIWHPVVWDLNLSLGGFRFLTRNQQLDNEELLTLSPFVHFVDKNPNRPLITRLLGRPLYRKMYVAHLQTIVEEQFTSGRYAERATAIRETITPLVLQEPNPLYPTELYTQNYHGTVEIGGKPVLGIEEFFQRRGDYLRAHPLFAKPVPEITAHRAERGEEVTTVSITLGSEVASEGVWVAHRPAGSGTFRFTRAEGAGTDYTLELPNGEIDDYFLVAEGKISAAVLPARSGREWFTVGTVGR